MAKFVFKLNLPKREADIKRWGSAITSSAGLAIAETAQNYQDMLVVLVPDFVTATRLEYELQAFLPQSMHAEILNFPDWETLPYDNFSPHQDIISQRLTVLYQLTDKKNGILIVPISTALHKICSMSYLLQNILLVRQKDPFNLNAFRLRLETAGYQFVNQVREHGEFSVRGSIIDLFPMGADVPYRIDLFGEEVDSIRSFDPETQLSIAKVASIKLLPAKEFPIDDKAISFFRNNWRAEFNGDPRNCSIYQDVSKGFLAPGLEYYLPLFFAECASLIDYLPERALIIKYGDIVTAATEFWTMVNHRYEQYSHDLAHPILKPNRLYIAIDELFHKLKHSSQIHIHQESIRTGEGKQNLPVTFLPNVTLASGTVDVLGKIQELLRDPNLKILLCAESVGRKTILIELFAKANLSPVEVNSWQEFLAAPQQLSISVMPLENGMWLTALNVLIITEFDIFGNKVMQRRRRKNKLSDPGIAINNLGELKVGEPVVHIEHGVGRYAGLQKLNVADQEGEFVVIEYAGNDKLYVPVGSLYLISRYSGANLEHAPLHSLGNNKWQKDKRKALEQIRDVAAELLVIYAKREMRKSFAFAVPDAQYMAFAAKFPFEETADQEQAITEVIADLTSSKPMDRVICGDVGFGKTEVAMRAAFLAVQSNKQVAVLVPTTLLAQQHYQTFIDRFADFPVRIDVTSRFKTNKEQETTQQAIAEGKCDIVIGTHKLLQANVQFKDLGLLIIDEEHRFGVRQKERFKAFKAEVNILTMTATPIPRTLSMSLSKLRDLSIISTPPAKRLSIKTFVREYNKPLIQEAILRELRRGGQVYYLHNSVETILKTALEIQDLVSSASVAVAHGQMPERELEKVMADFYRRRNNVLVCTTIIETGIDIPTANTIIIERADRFGLAQLHQLRGRVGRSHHQAYAFCLTPPAALMTADAVKRLDALSELETLGSGFTLATHDLEIRGAGELLGEEQSGNMQAIGFSLYMELLEYAVKTLGSGKELDLDIAITKGVEIDLAIAALIPNNYLEDVHIRLVQYKRIAMAEDANKLNELKVEMIDRFGPLPEQVQNLFVIANLKLRCQKLGIIKVKVGLKSGLIEFNEKPNVDPNSIIRMLQENPSCYKLHGPNSIKFYQDLATGQDRVRFIEGMLDKVGAGLISVQ